LVVVRVLRLLRWHTLADGAALLAATDDPLGRTALITVHLQAPGRARLSARLADSRAVVSAALTVASGADEHFFGLGEQFGGVDQRGRRVGVLVQDGMTTIRHLGGYAPAPFFMSSRGYGFYLASTRPSRFSLDVPPETTTWQVTVQSAGLDCFVLDGPLPTDVLARYADLVGHPPMPPPWTLGVWKTAIGGQTRVLAEAQRLRRLHIPVSVIWTYDAVEEAVKLGWPYPIFARIPPGPYPDLPRFTATLHGDGFQVLGYLTPEFTAGWPGFTYPAQHGYFVRASGGRIHLLDLTNPAALAWWEGNERRILTTLGFDGFFLDLGDRLPPGARFFNGLGSDDMANRYPLLLAEAAAQVVRAVKPEALFVMRSSFAGAQPWQPAVWPGDQRANWSAAQGLPAAISAGLSWGISGAPFWGSDIGGYLDGGLPQSQREELWLRWLEFGSLSPIMRDQLGNMDYNAVYLWSNSRTEEAFRFYAQLHQTLVPYLCAAARTAHLTGLPIMRHLFLAFPHDPRVYALNDEYLLGPDLLVAPVIAPGATSRQVYLPAGTWVDYWTGAVEAGGRLVGTAAPLDRIPLFVRGGALLPTPAEPGDTLATAGDPTVREFGPALRVRLYRGGTGETITLADGSRLGGSRDARGYTLRITGPIRIYIFELPLAAAPLRVRVAGHDLAPSSGWHYDRQAGLLQVTARMASGTVTVEAEVP
jgi:alpha-D-xyloside xylohydrolase